MKKISKKLSISTETVRNLATDQLGTANGGMRPATAGSKCYCETDRAGCSNWCGGSVLC
ncbi:MAG: class I lanthipeptide [Deltaproteobacteria bacterium]|nr:class I lanthipeptide [Deltaproteobacteria bacterium]